MSSNESNGSAGIHGSTNPRSPQFPHDRNQAESASDTNQRDNSAIWRRPLAPMPNPRPPSMRPNFPMRPPVGFGNGSAIGLNNTVNNPSNSSMLRRRPVPPPPVSRNLNICVSPPPNNALQCPVSPRYSQGASGAWHGHAAAAAAEGIGESPQCSSPPPAQDLHGSWRPSSPPNSLMQEHFQNTSNPVVGIPGMVAYPPAVPLEEAIRLKDEGRVIDLLNHGCNPNGRTSSGEPLVILAVRSANENIVKLLVSAGADVNCQDSNQYTPLHHAAKEGHRNLIQFLLTRGANMHARSLYGLLPISIATDPQTRDLLIYQMRLYVESRTSSPIPRTSQTGQDQDSLISGNPSMNFVSHPGVSPTSSNASTDHGQRFPTAAANMPFPPPMSPSKIHVTEAVTMPPKKVHFPVAITMPTNKVHVPEAVAVPDNKVRAPEVVTMPTNKLHACEAVTQSEPVVAEGCENDQHAAEKNRDGTNQQSSLDREIEEMEEKLRLARLQKQKINGGTVGASGKQDTKPAPSSNSDSECREKEHVEPGIPSEEDLKAIRKDWHEAAMNGCIGCGKAGCGGGCLPQKKEASKPNDNVGKSDSGTPEQERHGKMKWTKGELLGEGAYGKVFTGLNQSTGELMAVKQLKMNELSDPKERATYLASLQREIGLYKKVRHKHIVGYIDMENDETTGSLYIFLDYVSGGSILSMLERFGPFSEPLVKVYTRQLLLGLEYLHANKIVHRDIKGGNVLVDTDGIVKLADFGASKAFSDPTITDGCKSIRGSVFWMAPEVIKGDGYGRRADIWSVGCTVIEMITASKCAGTLGQELTTLGLQFFTLQKPTVAHQYRKMHLML